jgi:hypothetical protein
MKQPEIAPFVSYVGDALASRRDVVFRATALLGGKVVVGTSEKTGSSNANDQDYCLPQGLSLPELIQPAKGVKVPVLKP